MMVHSGAPASASESVASDARLPATLDSMLVDALQTHHAIMLLVYVV